MAGSSPLTRITSNIINELHTTSANIAAQMKAEVIDPRDVQSKQDYIDYVDRQWDDPKFRQDLHQQVGDQHMIAIAQDVLKKRAEQGVVAGQPPTVGAAGQSAGQIAGLMPPMPAAPPMAPPPMPPQMPPPMMPPPPPPDPTSNGLPPGMMMPPAAPPLPPVPPGPIAPNPMAPPPIIPH